MINKIQALFDAIKQLAILIQFKEQNGFIVDGRGLWGQIEELTQKIDQSFGTYTSLELEEFCKKVKSVDEKFHLSIDEMNPKSNHFLLQLCNIPYKKSKGDIYLNRVLQLGLNAGQLFVFYKMGNLNQEIKEVINDNIFDIDFYLNTIQITAINDQITDEKFDQLMNKINELDNQLTEGSQYFKKYMKYKLKYFEEIQKKQSDDVLENVKVSRYMR